MEILAHVAQNPDMLRTDETNLFTFHSGTDRCLERGVLPHTELLTAIRSSVAGRLCDVLHKSLCALSARFVSRT